LTTVVGKIITPLKQTNKNGIIPPVSVFNIENSVNTQNYRLEIYQLKKISQLLQPAFYFCKVL